MYIYSLYNNFQNTVITIELKLNKGVYKKRLNKMTCFLTKGGKRGFRHCQNQQELISHQQPVVVKKISQTLCSQGPL